MWVVTSHAPRQLPSWLIYDVRQKMLFAFLVGYFAAACGAHWFAQKKKLPHGAVAATHAVSAVIAVVLILMFFVWPTPTVRQFAGDDATLQKRWMAWVPLFFPLLFATAIAAVIGLIAAVRYCFVRDHRSWAIIALLSCVGSTLAFLAVLSLAPTA